MPTSEYKPDFRCSNGMPCIDAPTCLSARVGRRARADALTRPKLRAHARFIGEAAQQACRDEPLFCARNSGILNDSYNPR